MRKIKIGQIGIGHNHAEAKMLSVRKFPDLFEVVGYAETNEDWIKTRGGNVGYQGLIKYEVDELINKCDAILVETDVWDLTKIAQKCVLAGKHIHMDKPASENLEEFRAMLDIAESKNLVVQLGYMYRYNPAIQKSINLVKSGDLGEIYSINAEMSTCHSAQYRKWLTNFKGGIMYILGCHLIDIIVYLLGEPKTISAFLKKTNQDGIEVEDNNFVILEYDKTIARIYVSSVEVNGFGRRQFVISGSEGTIDIKPIESPCVFNYSDKKNIDNIYTDNKVTEILKDDLAYGRYDNMMKDFYEYVVGNKENPYTYEHEYKVQKVLMQIVNDKK